MISSNFFHPEGAKRDSVANILFKDNDSYKRKKSGKNLSYSMQIPKSQVHFVKKQENIRYNTIQICYVFECADSHKPHHAMIEDWELGELWLNEVVRLGDDHQAELSVR